MVSLEMNNAQRHLNRIIGFPASPPKRTNGSSFFLDIGDPLIRNGESSVHGEFHFLFQNCDWRFVRDKNIIVGSADDSSTIEESFRSSELCYIADVNLSQLGDLTITFTSGIVFETFLSLSNKEPISVWTFYQGPTDSWGLSTESGLTFEGTLDE